MIPTRLDRAIADMEDFAKKDNIVPTTPATGSPQRSHTFLQSPTERPEGETRPCRCGCLHDGKGFNDCTCFGWTDHRYQIAAESAEMSRKAD